MNRHHAVTAVYYYQISQNVNVVSFCLLIQIKSVIWRVIVCCVYLVHVITIIFSCRTYMFVLYRQTVWCVTLTCVRIVQFVIMYCVMQMYHCHDVE